MPTGANVAVVMLVLPVVAQALPSALPGCASMLTAALKQPRKEADMYPVVSKQVAHERVQELQREAAASRLATQARRARRSRDVSHGQVGERAGQVFVPVGVVRRLRVFLAYVRVGQLPTQPSGDPSRRAGSAALAPRSVLAGALTPVWLLGCSASGARTCSASGAELLEDRQGLPPVRPRAHLPGMAGDAAGLKASQATLRLHAMRGRGPTASWMTAISSPRFHHRPPPPT
jgi:hypothetical protein